MATPHSLRSRYREMLLEHLLSGEIMKELWLRGNRRMEVLKPQVDDGGYDLVLEANGIVRHVQLKASHTHAATPAVKVCLDLERKPSGCVVWTLFDENTLILGPFRWFGARPGKPLPSLSSYPTATHTKRNAAGIKGERANHRVIPRREFELVETVSELTMRLFGTIDWPV